MVPVLEVKRNGLCIACGACVIACPAQKLLINYNHKLGFFEIEQDVTRACSCKTPLCGNVCPSIESELDFKASSPNIDTWVGPLRQARLAWSTDREIRFNSSSGGSARTLLHFLLETGEVDRAIVLCPGEDPYYPQFTSLSDPEELARASNSFYLHVPFEKALCLLKENGAESRSVVVALPCQIQAIRKLQALHILLRGSILIVGLFCGGSSRQEALNKFLFYKGFHHKSIREIELRGQGWPGKITIDGKVMFDRKRATFISRALYNVCFSGPFFLKRCRLCSDQTAELADISFGDAWIPRITESDHLGTNVVLIRSDWGQAIFDAAIRAGVLESALVTLREVIDSQGNCLVGRKLGMWNWPSQRVVPSQGFGFFGRTSVEWPSRHVPPLGEVIWRKILWGLARSRIGGQLVFPLNVLKWVVVRGLRFSRRRIRAWKTLVEEDK